MYQKLPSLFNLWTDNNSCNFVQKIAQSISKRITCIAYHQSPHVVFITRFVVNPERVELIDETRRGTTQKIPDIHDNTSVNILSKYFSDNADTVVNLVNAWYVMPVHNISFDKNLSGFKVNYSLKIHEKLTVCQLWRPWHATCHAASFSKDWTVSQRI